MTMTRAAWAYRRGAVIAVFAALTVFGSSLGEAAEQACNQLGGNCVCARSLGATGWVAEPAAGFPGAYYEANQDTSDEKLCGFVANGRKLIYSSGAAPQTTTGLNGRPALLNTATGGTLNVEPSDAMKGRLTGRVGMRYYFKLGSGYQTQNEAACTNDKYIQLGDYMDANSGGFKSSATGGNYSGNPTPRSLIGKWMRIELYLDSYSNPQTFTSYLKNVTDNTPEMSVTFPARLALNREWLTGFAHIIHHYRAGTCQGTAAFMYAIMAHWPNSAGQRIPPAAELEGGGGGGGGVIANSPPQIPTGLTVR